MSVNETNNQKFHHQPNYYAIIPADVRYSDLSSSAKLLYGEITALCGKEGYCWATNSYFANLYNVAPTTISEWVSSLVKKGFITVEIPDKTNRKIYLTLREKPKGASGNPETYPSGKAEDNNTSVNNKNNTSSGGVDFEEFWKLYPRKVEKKKAKARWNHLKKSDQEAILADLPKRKLSDKWQKDGGQYIPYPLTYLNGERWNDEITATPTTTNSTTGRNFTQERIEDEREREREREQARQNRMVEQRADPNSPAVQKFRAMKDKFKIGEIKK